MSNSGDKKMSRSLIASLPLALMLAACGGGGSGGGDRPQPEDPLLPYKTQTLDWASCPEDIADPAITAQCATVRAPMDYDDPSLGEVEIAVMRVPARQPEQRRGAVFFNPGGPGADGLRMAGMLHAIFADSNPDDSLGAMQLRLLDQYDMIGFSPRGTGESTSLECESDELLRPVDYSAGGRHTPGNVDNMLHNGRVQAQACLDNPLTPYINTEDTVQDMDLIRGLLNDEKLNYIGYSYGTWLGAWYASRFPERAGRMVLDSSMDFTSNAVEADFLQPMARERWLDQVLAPYAARHPAYFGLGNQPEQIRAIISSLLPQLQVILSGELGGASYSSSAADDAVLTILAARELDGILRALPGADDEILQLAIQNHTFVPSNPALEERVGTLAESLLENYIEMIDSSMEPETVYLEAEDATFWAVTCNDTPSSKDPDFWVRKGDEFALSYPLFGTSTTEYLCAHWSEPSVTHPGLDGLRPLDLMMVQSGYDNATAYEGAIRMFQALPAVQGVFVMDDYQHGLYPYMDRCVDTAVTAYLLGESSPVRETHCPALLLEQDKQASESSMQSQNRSKAAGLLQGNASSAYQNPAETSELIEQFKDNISRLRGGR